MINSDVNGYNLARRSSFGGNAWKFVEFFSQFTHFICIGRGTSKRGVGLPVMFHRISHDI